MVDNVSVRELPTITHDGTSTLTYRSQGDGFTGTAGTAYNIRFGDVEHIPCSEGQGSILHGTLLEQEYSVVNGQASNWTTFQDEYFYDVIYGFNLVSGVKIPASQINTTLDVLGDSLSNPAKIGLNDSGATINFSPVENSWPDIYSIPGADLSNYEFDGDPGDIQININRDKQEARFTLES